MALDQDVRTLVQELSRGILEGQLRNLRHYTELRELIATGAIEERSVAAAYRSYVREVSASYNRRLADLSVRYYADLLEVGNDFSRQFYERILGGIGQSHAPGAQQRPVPMELSGPLGEHAEGRFELTNDQPDPVDVSFLVSPLHGPDGSVFRPVAVFEPAQARLGPAEVLPISIRVMLEPAMFEPNRIYTGTVEVLGYPDVALALSVWAAEARTAPEVTITGGTPAEEDASAMEKATPAGRSRSRSATAQKAAGRQRNAQAS